ncbi:MAG TPA: DUF1440 domain-containing protein [Pyrinomonadaceae bacterium]|jgi:uncharacterized membrane protein YagU involved in acid resistance
MRGLGRRAVGAERDVLKGLAAGLVGGLFASFVMNRFQASWSRLSEGAEKSHGAQSMQPSTGEDEQTSGVEKVLDDDATEKLAEAVAESVFDRHLSKSGRARAGTLIHYAYGTGTGALYGAVAELSPGMTSGSGLLFGAGLWAIGDEGLVPALGLSKGPASYKLSTHAYSLASHLVYGLSTELIRRTLRR